VNCLIAALLPHPTAKKIPLLILDEFNHRGVDEVNIQLMDAFMRQIYGGGIISLVITQDKGIALELIKLNKFQKIEPLPSALDEVRGDEGIQASDFTIVKHGRTTHWKWKSFDWDVDELVNLATKRCEKQGLALPPEVRQRISRDMTPTEVAGIVDTLCDSQR
jgi:hypothetical protein